MFGRIGKWGWLFLLLGKLLVWQLVLDVSQTTPALYAAETSQTSTTQLLLRLTPNRSPSYSWLAASNLLTPSIDSQLEERIFAGKLPRSTLAPINPDWLQPALNHKPADWRLVDHWHTLFLADFSSTAALDTSPTSHCTLSELSRSTYDLDRAQEQRALHFNHWLSRSQHQRLPLNEAQYTLPFDSWLLCGPFNVGSAQPVLLQFEQWLQFSSAEDSLFWGVSQDGRHFTGMVQSGNSAGWNRQQILLSGIPNGSEVWLAWNLRSKQGVTAGSGAWISTPQLLAYEASAPMVDTCSKQDSGNKGVMLPAYDPTTGGNAPILRSGDVVALDALLSSGANWVRLDFSQQQGVVDFVAYDRIIDTLCANGINVLGLINDQTLARRDYAKADSATAYRQEFVHQAAFLAEHFRGRINVWEVWNEPNYHEGSYLPPDLYAPLLQSTSQMIRRVNPRAKIVFGGLASAWFDSYQYLEDVYATWAANGASEAPFDILAIHPYADGWRHGGPRPENYLKARDRNANDPTILDRFVRLMDERGDGTKKIWVTEIGWNSSRGAMNSPWCLQQVVVSEREQAEYLTSGFDVLFRDVLNHAVEKVFWYQFMDVGMTGLCKWSSPERVYDAWYGLYRGDKVTPKPLQCAFRAYPDPCPKS